MAPDKIGTSLLEAVGEATPQAGVSLGKGAWDCDLNCEIPPEKEVLPFTALVFC